MQTNWPERVDEARDMQERDRKLIRIVPLKTEPARVAGVDAAFAGDTVFAAACLFRYPEMSLIEQATAALKAAFPYIPGYLLFLEGPAIIRALSALRTKPDIILVDGQGLAHPRGIGSAAHLGVLLDIPTIGCAKTRLVGEYREPGGQKGSRSELRYQGRPVGSVVRTRARVKPLFVSPGHQVDIESAVTITLGCTGRFRIPEPLRCADMASRRIKTAQGAPAEAG